MVIFHPAALDELQEAAKYYEGQRDGLGRSFLQIAQNGTRQIAAHLRRWRTVQGRFRRLLLGKFPYGIIYAAEEEQAYVIAVMHMHRKPEYWMSRTKDK